MKAIKDILQENAEQLSDFIYGKPNSSNGSVLKSEFKSLDQLIAGFQEEDVVVIGGRPAMGKSALMLSMAYNMAKNGKKVVFFSLDENIRMLILKLIAHIAGPR